MNSLAGIKILDLSRLLPGPYATQLLADLGAQVLKIERPPLGDYARTMPPFWELDAELVQGAVFCQNNRNKSSIALDFDHARGRELVLRLCEQADVLIESFRPEMLERRGLGYETVRAHNPRLVYCSLSGYGQTGDYRDRAGHDLNYLALAGILKLNGARAQTPVPMPVQVADLAGAMRAALQICAALVERERTGAGTFLDIALFDAAVDWMQTVVGATARAEGENPTRQNMQLTGAYPCYNIYETRDGEFMALGALEPMFWRAFCIQTERPDLLDAQFDAEATGRVAECFKTRTRAEWIEFSQRVDCCLEPLLDVSETWAHPQVVARHLAETQGHVPRLGEDTERVLREFGIAESELAELRETKIIGA